MPTRRSHLPLAEALAALLSEQRADHYGRWAFRPFTIEVAEKHGGYTPGGIRPMIEGRAKPNLLVLETMADLLGVKPEYFLEYRLGKLEELQRAKPDLVDLLYDTPWMRRRAGSLSNDDTAHEHRIAGNVFRVQEPGDCLNLPHRKDQQDATY